MPREVKLALVAVVVIIGLWAFLSSGNRDRPQGDALPTLDEPPQEQAQSPSAAQQTAGKPTTVSGVATTASSAAVVAEPSRVKTLERQLERERRKVSRLKVTADVGADVLAKTGVYGNVHHPDKNPAARAGVAVSSEEHGARESTETDTKGHYELTGLKAGPYRAMCDLYPERDVPITIVYGKMTRQDFGGDRGVSVYGYVTHADGTPVAGRIMMADATHTTSFFKELDAEGYYEFEGVPRNEYRVNIYKATGGYVRAGFVELPEHVSEHRHDIELSALAIGGTVTAADGGEPVPGGTVQARCHRGGQLYSAVAKISETGQFQLASLVPGQYSLSFMVDGYAIEKTSVLVVEEKGVSDLRVELTPVSPAWFIVSDQHGVPVSSHVRYTVSSGSLNLSTTSHPLEDGSLVLRLLPPGEYRLQLTAEGHGDFQGSVTIPEEGFPADAPFEIEMQKLK